MYRLHFVKELWHFIEEHLTVGCKSALDTSSDLKFTSKILTIKSQTLCKTISKSLFAKVANSGFKYSSEKADIFNFAKFENSTKSRRKMRRHSDITGMLPDNGNLQNTIKLTFLEHNHIASTLPKFNVLKNASECRTIMPKLTFGKARSVSCKEQGKTDEKAQALVKLNSTRRARRKTICCASLSNNCADHLDCSDEADKEIQEIFEKASKQRQVSIYALSLRISCYIMHLNFSTLAFHFQLTPKEVDDYYICVCGCVCVFLVFVLR